MKKIILAAALLIIAAISTLGYLYKDYIFNNSDIQQIKSVILKAAIMPEETYIAARNSYKAGTIADNKKKIIEDHSKSFDDVFSKDSNPQTKFTFVDMQVNSAQEGIDTLECGVSGVIIEKISIKNGTANVTAIVNKYTIDRVEIDGKYFLDKMSADTKLILTLKKEENKWKIRTYGLEPQYDDPVHTFTEEN